MKSTSLKPSEKCRFRGAEVRDVLTLLTSPSGPSPLSLPGRAPALGLQFPPGQGQGGPCWCSTPSLLPRGKRAQCVLRWQLENKETAGDAPKISVGKVKGGVALVLPLKEWRGRCWLWRLGGEGALPCRPWPLLPPSFSPVPFPHGEASLPDPLPGLLSPQIPAR